MEQRLNDFRSKRDKKEIVGKSIIKVQVNFDN